ncbi:MAG: hypothetical protein IPK78_04220 [Rhodospirillales bacterium]|nr:hypothetical protein [Rhodospirillales bacterium]
MKRIYSQALAGRGYNAEQAADRVHEPALGLEFALAGGGSANTRKTAVTPRLDG